MKTILWLPSWYPNKTAAFDGDFIQRMAKAASLYAEIHVLYVVKDKNLKEDILITNHQEANLYETIVYYKQRSFFDKLHSWRTYFRLYKNLVRQFISSHGLPALIHVQVPLKAGVVALWCNHRYGIPFVLTEHYGIYNDVVDDRFSNRSFYFRYFTRRIIKKAAVFMPVSRQLAEAINKRVIKKNYTAIPNTVDTSLFYYKPATITGRFRFIHVSNMIPLKNVEGIINACKGLHPQHDFELIIVGDCAPAVRLHAEQSGLLNKVVFFRGEISYLEVAQEMQQAQALILFSNSENMPCVVLEALCCGLPVIATKVGGVPEVINADNGILIEPQNEPGLQQAMEQMIHHYADYNRLNIATNAAELFSYSTIGRQIFNAYLRVIESQEQPQ